MDHAFIDKMCNAYYNDFELYDKSLWEDKETGIYELTDHIKLLLDQCKLDDIDFYRSLFEYSRNHQYAMIYYMLDNYLLDNYSDSIDMEEINESLIATILAAGGLMTGAILIALNIKHIQKGITKSINALVNTTNKIAGFISKLGTSSAIKNSVIYANFQTCGGKCGITNIKDLSIFTPHDVSISSTFSDRGSNQAKCLVNCWFNFMMDNIRGLVTSYMECLRNSGDDFAGASSITLIMKEPMSSQCKVYFDNLKEHYAEFKRVNEYVNRTDHQLQQTWMNNYHKAIDDGFKATGFGNKLFKQNDFGGKSNNSFNQNRKPFNNQNRKPFNNSSRR